MNKVQEISIPLTHGELNGKKPISIVRAAARIAVLSKENDTTRCLLVNHPIKGFELPGGALEHGETPQEAAFRELKEEAGLILDNTTSAYLFEIVPIIDGNGGHWIDIIYTTIINDEQLSYFKNEREFDIKWFSYKEIEEYKKGKIRKADIIKRLITSSGKVR